MVKRDIYQEIKQQPKRGVLIILAGPSGAGKDVLIDELMKEDGRVIRLVTTTTRPKRLTEVDGRDYHFINRAGFEKLIVEDKFFEWVEYRSHLYGGQKKHIEEALKTGKDVLWRIDVKGVKNIKDKVRAMISDPKSVINLVAFVFLTGPTLAVMEERMKKRGTESVEWQRWSADVARWEMEQFEDFDYLVVNYNSHLNDAVAKVRQIIEVQRMKIVK